MKVIAIAIGVLAGLATCGAPARAAAAAVDAAVEAEYALRWSPTQGGPSSASVAGNVLGLQGGAQSAYEVRCTDKLDRRAAYAQALEAAFRQEATRERLFSNAPVKTLMPDENDDTWDTLVTLHKAHALREQIRTAGPAVPVVCFVRYAGGARASPPVSGSCVCAI